MSCNGCSPEAISRIGPRNNNSNVHALTLRTSFTATHVYLAVAGCSVVPRCSPLSWRACSACSPVSFWDWRPGGDLSAAGEPGSTVRARWFGGGEGAHGGPARRVGATVRIAACSSAGSTPLPRNPPAPAWIACATRSSDSNVVTTWWSSVWVRVPSQNCRSGLRDRPADAGASVLRPQYEQAKTATGMVWNLRCG